MPSYPNPNVSHEGSSLTRTLDIFFRRRWLFYVPVLAGLVGAIIIGGFLPKVYEASAIILVNEEKIMNPLIQGLAISTPASQRIRTLREEILSWDRLVRLIQELQLGQGVRTQESFEKLIADLRKKIIVQMRGPDLIRIAYQGPDPEGAQRLVKTVMALFIDENVKAQTKEAGVAIDFLQGQLKVYRRKIRETEIAGMEEELKSLLVDSTEAHPLVQELRQKIAQAQADLTQVEKANPPPAPIPDPYYNQIQQMLSNQQAQGLTGTPVEPPEGLDPELFGLYVLMSQATTGAYDSSVNVRIYNQLLSRLETARITQQLDASKEGTRYTVLDPPRLPIRPVKPNRWVVALMGILLGGVTGAGLILLAEMADSSFRTVEEVVQALELPVVGAINTIQTADELQKGQVKRRFATLAVSGVVAAVLAGSAILSWIH